MLRPNHTFVSIRPTTKIILQLLATRLNLPMKHFLDIVLKEYLVAHEIDVLRPLRDPSIFADFALPQAAERL